MWLLRPGGSLELNDSYQDEDARNAAGVWPIDVPCTQRDCEEEADEGSASAESVSEGNHGDEAHPDIAPEHHEHGDGSAPSSDTRAAMLLACEQHRAAQLRAWEHEVMREAMDGSTTSHGLLIVIRGGVRRAHGGQDTTQTIMFRVQEGVSLDLRVSMPEYANARPEPDKTKKGTSTASEPTNTGKDT